MSLKVDISFLIAAFKMKLATSYLLLKIDRVPGDWGGKYISILEQENWISSRVSLILL